MDGKTEISGGKSAEPIAIIGVGCRLPGNISTVEELVAALQEGRDCITDVPQERWDVDSFFDPDPLTPGKSYVRHGGFVADIKHFDAAFFGISDVEASRMDPQQRLVLESVWHALEHAGQSADELSKSNTGVFLAMMNTNTYAQLKFVHEGLAGVTGYDLMGDAMSMTAGRISHFFGLEGPCLALDTACSGSMVALHLARQSILTGECDSAIVAGVNAILSPHVHIFSSKMGLMSRSGHCKSFDEGADGYIRGEGCVAVLLRRQSVAVARGDHILASLRATAINHDGRTPAVTTPNGETQEKVMRLALARAGIDPQDIGYVEAHGTGTPVGDPIEMTALVNVYGKGRSEQEPLYVGSAKSNFGHIEPGAGLLGVVKAALSLDLQQIFPSLHFKKWNPNIDLGKAALRVPTTTIGWPRRDRRRMVGINSFGFSGTNAHAILQEAPQKGAAEVRTPALPCQLIVLSAKSSAGLQELADRWLDFLEQENQYALEDIAFTAAAGRNHFRHRLAMVARDKQEASEKLRLWREGRMPKKFTAGQIKSSRKPKVAFVFTGQGAQYASMGRQLYETEPYFRAAIERCATIMSAELGVPLLDVLFGPNSAELLGNTRYVQPGLFAIEYALAELLRRWGIEPDYMIGHSVGEIVAAAQAGILEFEDAVQLVVARGRLMGELPRLGKMLAVDATPEQTQEWLVGKEADVSIAAINGPTSIVVSGTVEGVEQVAQLAAAAKRPAKELEVSHAFHSPLMEPILEELEGIAATLRVAAPKRSVVSNVTGEFLSGQIPAHYWSSHVRQPVLFHQGMCKLVEAGCTLFIEVGPHPALGATVTAAFEAAKVRSIPTLARDQQDVANILQTVGAAYVIGVPLPIDLFSRSCTRRVALPLYPFRRDRHWIRSDRGYMEPSKIAVESAPKPKTDLHPLLGRATSLNSHRAVFESTLAATQPWVDHRILGSTVFPATAYLEMVARGFAEFNGHQWQSTQLLDVSFERPLVLAYGKQQKAALMIEASSSKGTRKISFAIGATGGAYGEHYCRGRIALAGNPADKVSIENDLARMQSKLEPGPFYGELRKRNFEYGASFSTVRELWLGASGSGEAIARITASPRGDGTETHPFTYTTVLDGCLQVFGAAIRTLDSLDQPGAFVPRSIKSVTLHNRPFSQVWSHATVRMNDDNRSLLARIHVVTEQGDVLADIDGLELRNIARFSLMRDGRGNGAEEHTTESREQLVARLHQLPSEQRVGAVAKWLIDEVKDILGQTAEEIDLDSLDPSSAFIEIGLDSLLMTELQRRIQEKLEFRFKPMQRFDYQSADSLAEYILNEVLLTEPAGVVAPKTEGAPRQQTGD